MLIDLGDSAQRYSHDNDSDSSCTLPKGENDISLHCLYNYWQVLQYVFPRIV